MGFKEGSGGFFGSLVFIICFIIGCLFLYWAVEYWVYNNLDRGRYEIVKIQPAGGGDSWTFWKLDRRTGRVEYCSLVLGPNATKVDETTEFTCLRAREVVSEDPQEVARRQAAQPTFGRVDTTETPAVPAVDVDSTSATPATAAEGTEVTTTP